MEIALRRGSALPLSRDILICLATGWSWSDLAATPSWVVDDVWTYLTKQSLVEAERARMADSKGRH